jgi:hypothetical protein
MTPPRVRIGTATVSALRASRSRFASSAAWRRASSVASMNDCSSRRICWSRGNVVDAATLGRRAVGIATRPSTNVPWGTSDARNVTVSGCGRTTPFSGP